MAPALARGQDVDRDAGTATVRVTLSDGFAQWYEVDGATYLIESSRSFRAFHPDQDPEATWVESRYGDHFTSEGVTRARRSWSVDRATGDTLATTTILEVRHH